ncbi:MAG: hypothetical protein AAB372_00340 [Patescibacteria group bacterium]
MTKFFIETLAWLVAIVVVGVSCFFGFLLCFGLTPCAEWNGAIGAFYVFFVIIPFSALGVVTVISFLLKSRWIYAGLLLDLSYAGVFAYIFNSYQSLF